MKNYIIHILGYVIVGIAFGLGGIYAWNYQFWLGMVGVSIVYLNA